MIQAIAQEQRLYTPEEYLDLEVDAEFRSEYDNGVITSITGGTTNHNQLSINCTLALTLGTKTTGISRFHGRCKSLGSKISKVSLSGCDGNCWRA